MQRWFQDLGASSFKIDENLDEIYPQFATNMLILINIYIQMVSKILRL